MGRAWVREIADSFTDAIVGFGGRRPDVELARSQHREYCSRIVASGHHLTTVAADDDHPDCVFIEDVAVIIGGRALITRPGARPRRGEAGPVGEELSKHFPITTMDAPASLDGGDVMLIGTTVYVGLSERTNEAGFECLGAFAAEAGLNSAPVPVNGVLHLKSGVLPVSPEAVVVTPGTVDESLLAGLRIFYEDSEERHLFSALVLPDSLLVTSAAPRTGDQLARAGMQIDPIDVSEILAADGGLTCMSLLTD